MWSNNRVQRTVRRTHSPVSQEPAEWEPGASLLFWVTYLRAENMGFDLSRLSRKREEAALALYRADLFFLSDAMPASLLPVRLVRMSCLLLSNQEYQEYTVQENSHRSKRLRYLR